MKGKIFSFIIGVGCGICLLLGFQYQPEFETVDFTVFTDSLIYFPGHKIMVTSDSQCWFPVDCPQQSSLKE